MAMPDAPRTQSLGPGAALTPAALAADEFTRGFSAAEVTDLRHDLRRRAQACGLLGDALDDFVTAVNELVTNAVRHGGGRGRVRLTVDAGTLIADVSDRGAGFAGRPPEGSATGLKDLTWFAPDEVRKRVLAEIDAYAG